MEQARKSKKNRIFVHSEDESDEDEDSDRAVMGRTDEATKTLASGGESEPSGTDKEQTPKNVGNKRKHGEEATRRSTQQRGGVDKMSGVMIHRIEHK